MSKVKKDKICSKCIWSTFLRGDSTLESGYICKLNPFNPVGMGFNGKHSNRKAHIEARKEERKLKLHSR